MSARHRSKKASQPEPQLEPEWEDQGPEPEWKRIGLQNVGNSCYLNAALQLLLVFFRYIPVSVPDPPSESPPSAICEYFPAGRYTFPKSGQISDFANLHTRFPGMTTVELDALPTHEGLKISRDCIIPIETRLPLMYLVTSIIRNMIDGLETPFCLLKALQLKLKGMQKTAHVADMTEDASDIFFRLVECKNYLMQPLGEAMERAFDQLQAGATCDDYWLKEQLEPYRTEQPEFTGAVDVKRWLICNWESDRFGDEFVQ
jgi:hypothetical protein